MQALVDTRRDPGATVVTVSGDIDVSCIDALLDVLMRAMRRLEPHLLLDLSGVTFLDCAGLTALIQAHRHAENCHGSLRVIAVSDQVNRIIELTGPHDLCRWPALKSAARR
jgi:anti-anti-sigma factor